MKTEFNENGCILFLPETEFEAFAIFNWFKANTKFNSKKDEIAGIYYIDGRNIAVSLEGMNKND